MESQPIQPATEQPTGQSSRRRGPGKPFVKGDPRIKQHLEMTAQQALPAVGPVDLYADMLHVYTRPASEDGTQAQRDCRAWKKKDLRGFMGKFADLEKVKAAEAGKEGVGPAPEQIDEGSERCFKLIDALLDEWEGSEEAKETPWA